MKNHLFLVKITYLKELDVIDELMKKHVAYLKKYYKQNRFIFSGRQFPRTGGIILSYGENLNDVETVMNADPFMKAGAASYEVIEFRATMYSEVFKNVLDLAT